MARKKITELLADLKSAETKAIRIDRTSLKQWQKSAQLREQACTHPEFDKWEQVKKTYRTQSPTSLGHTDL